MDVGAEKGGGPGEEVQHFLCLLSLESALAKGTKFAASKEMMSVSEIFR